MDGMPLSPNPIFAVGAGLVPALRSCAPSPMRSLRSPAPPFALTQSVVFQENLTATASVIIASYTLYTAKNYKTDPSYSAYAKRGFLGFVPDLKQQGVR
jgi:hypothetical protein